LEKVDEFGSTFFKGGLEKVDNLAPPFLKVEKVEKVEKVDK
jgi:hypothetical protein